MQDGCDTQALNLLQVCRLEVLSTWIYKNKVIPIHKTGYIFYVAETKGPTAYHLNEIRFEGYLNATDYEDLFVKLLFLLHTHYMSWRNEALRMYDTLIFPVQDVYPSECTTNKLGK